MRAIGFPSGVGVIAVSPDTPAAGSGVFAVPAKKLGTCRTDLEGLGAEGGVGAFAPFSGSVTMADAGPDAAVNPIHGRVVADSCFE
jgi:hypothetical protein